MCCSYLLATIQQESLNSQFNQYNSNRKKTFVQQGQVKFTMLNSNQKFYMDAMVIQPVSLAHSTIFVDQIQADVVISDLWQKIQSLKEEIATKAKTFYHQ